MYYRKPASLVLVLSREASKEIALSVVTGDSPNELVLRAMKTLALVSQQGYGEAIVISCVRVYKHNL